MRARGLRITAVIRYLLSHDGSSAKEVSEGTDIPLTTCVSILEELTYEPAKSYRAVKYKVGRTTKYKLEHKLQQSLDV